MQAIVRLPKDCPADTTRVWFVPDDTPYFYWLVPESSERGALGVIGEQGSDTKRRFERFLEKKHLEPLEWQGARIPVYRKWVPVRKRVGNGDVYLVGRRRCASESFHRGRHRHRLSRRAGCGAIHSASWPQR